MPASFYSRVSHLGVVGRMKGRGGFLVALKQRKPEAHSQIHSSRVPVKSVLNLASAKKISVFSDWLGLTQETELMLLEWIPVAEIWNLPTKGNMLDIFNLRPSCGQAIFSFILPLFAPLW